MQRSIRRTLAVFFLFASASALTLSPAMADQPKYWLDYFFDKCHAKESNGRRTVMAYSPAGYSHCFSGNHYSQRSARRAAIFRCESRMPVYMRKIAPCRVIYEEGKVLDPEALEIERAPYQIPMTFEVFDGIKNVTTTADGFMVFDKFSDENARPIRLVLLNDRVICEGTYGSKGIEGSSRMICFGKFRFEGNNIGRAGFFQSGQRYKKYYEINFERERSYIKARFRRR